MFECQSCSFNAESARKLKEHLKNFHLKDKFECHRCGFKTKTYKILTDHLKKPHDFLCDDCESAFTSKASRTKHIKKDHDECVILRPLKSAGKVGQLLDAGGRKRDQSSVLGNIFHQNRTELNNNKKDDDDDDLLDSSQLVQLLSPVRPPATGSIPRHVLITPPPPKDKKRAKDHKNEVSEDSAVATQATLDIQSYESQVRDPVYNVTTQADPSQSLIQPTPPQTKVNKRRPSQPKNDLNKKFCTAANSSEATMMIDEDTKFWVKIYKGRHKRENITEDEYRQVRNLSMEFAIKALESDEAVFEDFANSFIKYDAESKCGIVACSTERSQKWWKSAVKTAAAGDFRAWSEDESEGLIIKAKILSIAAKFPVERIINLVRLTNPDLEGQIWPPPNFNGNHIVKDGEFSTIELLADQSFIDYVTKYDNMRLKFITGNVQLDVNL